MCREEVCYCAVGKYVTVPWKSVFVPWKSRFVPWKESSRLLAQIFKDNENKEVTRFA